MALYALAAEVRSHIKEAREAGDQTNVAAWTERLRDLGLRVADALVEMGELETAVRHLDTSVDVEKDEIAYRKALLRLRVGDVAIAERCTEAIQDTNRRASLKALLHVANGDYEQAVKTYRDSTEEDISNPLAASNLAVALLYTGHIDQAKDLFEVIAEKQPTFPGLLFNLGTVYELCTDHAQARKVDLASKMASKTPQPDSGGWERSTFEFKL